jgi:diguanylate cyclase (GGDEF)-like protein
MNLSVPRFGEATGPKYLAWVLMAMWTAVVFLSLWWNLAQQQQETLKIATAAAKAIHERDLLYRRWASENRGVYIPLTPTTPSTPPPPHASPREVEGASSGPGFTLVNPDYMMRRVNELAKEAGKPQGRVTSLRRLHPENTPDAWEEKALEALAHGRTGFSSIEMASGQPYLRLMQPIVTEISCLGCHEEQAYRVGDLRGGISVAVPLAPLRQAARPLSLGLCWAHGLLWVLGLGGIMFGFNRLREDHNRIVALMFTDPLTGIANRRIFLESLGGAISFAQRHQAPLSIIMADLDHFKSVNDTFGHDAGDQVLQAFAILMVEDSRQEDLVARFGGEEFIMMLPGTDAEEATVIGERLRRHWEEMIFPDAHIKVTASFGVSGYQPGDTVASFIERADQALYEAKRLGRNQVIILEDEAKQIEAETQKLRQFVSLLAQ